MGGVDTGVTRLSLKQYLFKGLGFRVYHTHTDTQFRA